MFNVVLVDPQIPPNTGNIARTCAATDMNLIMVGDLGFSLSDKHLKRAGMDYWPHVKAQHLPDREAFLADLDYSRAYLLSKKVARPYTEIVPQPGDYFLFGSETTGLPEWLLEQNADRCATIPMPTGNVRSLNLATSVGIVMYHMLAQFNFGAPSGVGNQ